MLDGVVRFLKLHLLNISSRECLSRRYIRGCGLEIGAMHFPLPVAPGVCVKYVDVNTRAENIARYPEVDPDKIVETDYVEDGFTLSSFPAGSVDFVVANHVLEHSADPLGTLRNWSRVLKDDGILFVTVPNYRKCFDKGRKLTDLEHLIRDSMESGTDPASLKARNLDHYREWVEIVLPQTRLTNPSLPVLEKHEQQAMIRDLAESAEEIHFHTFDRKLFKNMLEHYSSQDPSLQPVRIYNSSIQFEFMAVLRKSAPTGA